MQPNPLEILSTNLPRLKRELTLEYIKRSRIPFPTKYVPHIPEKVQLMFLELDCLDAFYGGAAGGGKSDALLMAALQYVDTPGYSALLIRDSFTNLVGSEGLIDRSSEWLGPTDAKWKDGKMWVWPNGSRLEFGYLDGPRDHFNFQSRAYQFVGIDEVVQIRQHQALYLFSRLRRLEKYRHVPIRFRCASNPPAKEQLIRGRWVKERYVDPAKERVRLCLGLQDDQIINVADLPYDIRPVIWEVEIQDPDTGLGEISKRAFMPATMVDNPHLDMASYRRSLSLLDRVTRRQLERGDWEIQQSGAIIDRTWFQIVPVSPVNGHKRVRYWDFAATKKTGDKDPCWTVGLKMSITPDGLIYIEDIKDVQGEPGTVERLVRQSADIDGIAVPVRAEQEPGSSGKASIHNYQRRILQMYDFKGIPSSGPKETRFAPFANQAEAGNVYIVRGPWNARYLDALEALPEAGWDYGDASSGAYNFLVGLDRAMGRIRTIDADAVKARPLPAAPFTDAVPVYHRGRFLGYEALTEADLDRRDDLLPTYENGRLVRCDKIR